MKMKEKNIGNTNALKIGKGNFAVVSGNILLIKRFENEKLARIWTNQNYNKRQSRWKIVEIKEDYF